MPRVIVVSNRLPVTVNPELEEPDDIKFSSGGLVSAFRSVVDEYDQIVWIGWPGTSLEKEEDRVRVEKRLKSQAEWQLIPVWLTQSEVDGFYAGFSNSSLWPLLHWMTPYARFKRVWAENYRTVNEKFTDVILQTAEQGDLVWIQDYHLFLVPQMIRKRESPGVQEELFRAGWIQRPKDLPPPLHEDEDEAVYEDSQAEHQEQLTDASAVTRRPTHLPDMVTPETPMSREQSPQDAAYLDSQGELSRFKSMELETSQLEALTSKAARLVTGTEDTDGEPPPVERQRSTASVGSATKTRTSSKEHEHFGFTPKIRRSVTAVEQNTKVKIAFFLHTPFPSYEVISVLPQCAEIVEGMLGADLIGFHTYSYLRHFRSCVIRLCGFTPEMDHVDHLGQRTKLGVFPIGANWQGIEQAMQSEDFKEHLASYTKQFEGKSLVLSVERLDYSKGLPQKLAAIQRYLEDVWAEKKAAKKNKKPPSESFEGDPSPENAAFKGRAERLEALQKRFEARRQSTAVAKGSLRRIGSSFTYLLGRALGNDAEENDPVDHSQTVFLFIAVPSRQEVQEYKSIEEEVHRTISTINGQFSTPTHQPIVYIHRSISMDELAALYARADICLVTPLIDGMNLVAKEYLVAKDPKAKKLGAMPGTIVLSELAGAAQELFDALVVNPYDEDAVADAIRIGLDLIRSDILDESQRWEVTERMRQSVRENDAVAWARSILTSLQDPLGSKLARPETMSLQFLEDNAAEAFFASRAGTKALFLDYDGTLRSFESRAEDATPTEELLEIMGELDKRKDLCIHIVSGRDTTFLEEHFGVFKSFTLIAEHGFMTYSEETDHSWQHFNPYTDVAWMEKIRPVMELFTRCTPGSHIEVKSSAIVWHFRECDEEYGSFKAKELTHQLALSLGNLPCQISQGHKIVEVASLQVKKGLIVRTTCLAQQKSGDPFTAVLCVGDDRTDESMFAEAPKDAYTVKVGLGETLARLRLRDPDEVIYFLKLIAEQVPVSIPEPASVPEQPTERKAVKMPSFVTKSMQGDERYHSVVDERTPDISPVHGGGDTSQEDDPLDELPEEETEAATGAA